MKRKTLRTGSRVKVKIPTCIEGTLWIDAVVIRKHVKRSLFDVTLKEELFDLRICNPNEHKVDAIRPKVHRTRFYPVLGREEEDFMRLERLGFSEEVIVKSLHIESDDERVIFLVDHAPNNIDDALDLEDRRYKKVKKKKEIPPAKDFFGSRKSNCEILFDDDDTSEGLYRKLSEGFRKFSEGIVKQRYHKDSEGLYRSPTKPIQQNDVHYQNSRFGKRKLVRPNIRNSKIRKAKEAAKKLKRKTARADRSYSHRSRSRVVTDASQNFTTPEKRRRKKAGPPSRTKPSQRLGRRGRRSNRTKSTASEFPLGEVFSDGESLRSIKSADLPRRSKIRVKKRKLRKARTEEIIVTKVRKHHVPPPPAPTCEAPRLHRSRSKVQLKPNAESLYSTSSGPKRDPTFSIHQRNGSQSSALSSFDINSAPNLDNLPKVPEQSLIRLKLAGIPESQQSENSDLPFFVSYSQASPSVQSGRPLSYSQYSSSDQPPNTVAPTGSKFIDDSSSEALSSKYRESDVISSKSSMSIGASSYNQRFFEKRRHKRSLSSPIKSSYAHPILTDGPTPGYFSDPEPDGYPVLVGSPAEPDPNSLNLVGSSPESERPIYQVHLHVHVDNEEQNEIVSRYEDENDTEKILNSLQDQLEQIQNSGPRAHRRQKSAVSLKSFKISSFKSSSSFRSSAYSCGRSSGLNSFNSGRSSLLSGRSSTSERADSVIGELFQSESVEKLNAQQGNSFLHSQRRNAKRTKSIPNPMRDEYDYSVTFDSLPLGISVSSGENGKNAIVKSCTGGRAMMKVLPGSTLLSMQTSTMSVILYNQKCEKVINLIKAFTEESLPVTIRFRSEILEGETRIPKVNSKPRLHRRRICKKGIKRSFKPPPPKRLSHQKPARSFQSAPFQSIEGSETN